MTFLSGSLHTHWQCQEQWGVLHALPWAQLCLHTLLLPGGALHGAAGEMRSEWPQWNWRAGLWGKGMETWRCQEPLPRLWAPRLALFAPCALICAGSCGTVQAGSSATLLTRTAAQVFAPCCHGNVMSAGAAEHAAALPWQCWGTLPKLFTAWKSGRCKCPDGFPLLHTINHFGLCSFL